MPETLPGLIAPVTRHNPENGFAVLKVKVTARRHTALKGRLHKEVAGTGGTRITTCPL
jgi:hypothetical protein